MPGRDASASFGDAGDVEGQVGDLIGGQLIAQAQFDDARQALGDKAGITRYADVTVPLDEAMSRVVVDISGRPHLVFRTAFHAAKIGSFDTQLVEEWFRAFAMQAGLTLHVETFYGSNDHHIAESCFKGLGRALRKAVVEGDLEEGCFLSGQVAAMVNKIQPAAEIVREVIEGAEPVLKGATQWVK